MMFPKTNYYQARKFKYEKVNTDIDIKGMSILVTRMPDDLSLGELVYSHNKNILVEIFIMYPHKDLNVDVCIYGNIDIRQFRLLDKPKKYSNNHLLKEYIIKNTLESLNGKSYLVIEKDKFETVHEKRGKCYLECRKYSYNKNVVDSNVETAELFLNFIIDTIRKISTSIEEDYVIDKNTDEVKGNGFLKENIYFKSGEYDGAYISNLDNLDYMYFDHASDKGYRFVPYGYGVDNRLMLTEKDYVLLHMNRLYINNKVNEIVESYNKLFKDYPDLYHEKNKHIISCIPLPNVNDEYLINIIYNYLNENKDRRIL